MHLPQDPSTPQPSWFRRRLLPVAGGVALSLSLLGTASLLLRVQALEARLNEVHGTGMEAVSETATPSAGRRQDRLVLAKAVAVPDAGMPADFAGPVRAHGVMSRFLSRPQPVALSDSDTRADLPAPEPEERDLPTLFSRPSAFSRQSRMSDTLSLLPGSLDAEVPVGKDSAFPRTLDSDTYTDLTPELQRALLEWLPSGWPVESGEISSDYGFRFSNGRRDVDFHRGVDLRATLGTTVHATADGVVSGVVSGFANGYGLRVTLTHELGFQTVYAHLERALVRPGDRIARGMPIAVSGQSGRVSGPHLHYEVLFQQQTVDPTAFLTWREGNFASIFTVDGIPWDAVVSTLGRRLGLPGRTPLHLAQQSAWR
ncbi:MAG: M23 family metallopeptidase [Magnetococcus sp. WYHC-3]